MARSVSVISRACSGVSSSLPASRCTPADGMLGAQPGGQPGAGVRARRGSGRLRRCVGRDLLHAHAGLRAAPAEVPSVEYPDESGDRARAFFCVAAGTSSVWLGLGGAIYDDIGTIDVKDDVDAVPETGIEAHGVGTTSGERRRATGQKPSFGRSHLRRDGAVRRRCDPRRRSCVRHGARRSRFPMCRRGRSARWPFRSSTRCRRVRTDRCVATRRQSFFARSSAFLLRSWL